jgi:hypothetical protein
MARMLNLGDYCVEGVNLLSKLNQVDDDTDESDSEPEELGVLDEAVVDKITKSREESCSLKQCARNKSKDNKWGAVLVARQRRSQNLGGQ